MPPRKSNASALSLANEDGTAGEGTPSRGRDGINIEDLSLPRTMVQRLAKGILPANTNITKDGITAMQKSATVFINHLAAQAHESIVTNNHNNSSNSRKTIPPQAISEALHDTEFDGFIARVEAELARFNEVQTGKRNDYRRKVKEGKNTSLGADGGGGVSAQGRGGGRAVAAAAAGGLEEGVRGRGRGMTGEGDVDMDEEDEDDGDGDERAVKRPRMAEGGGGGGAKGKERQRMNGIGGSPSAQLQPFEPGEFNPDEDPGQDDDDDPAEDEERGEGVNDEGDATEEDEDDEDDEDEYPDAGHRAESLGMEDPEEEERQRRGRYGYGAGDDTSEDEDMG